MSPEPTQEPIEEHFNVPNLTIDARMLSESDSEDEDIEMAGYLPLSQVPDGSDTLLNDDEDDDWTPIPGQPSEALRHSITNTEQDWPSETIEVWSSTCKRSNIDLDMDKINQVKSVMANFTLPTTSIPEWANRISEDQWKEELIDRIKEIQSRDKRD